MSSTLSDRDKLNIKVAGWLSAVLFGGFFFGLYMHTTIQTQIAELKLYPDRVFFLESRVRDLQEFIKWWDSFGFICFCLGLLCLFRIWYIQAKNSK